MRVGRPVLVVALVAVAAMSPAGHAHGACQVLADPSGDVTLRGQLGAAGALPDNGHVDLTEVDLSVTRARVVATIHVVALDAKRLGQWTFAFTSGRDRLVMAAGIGAWVNVGDYHGVSGFLAGRSGERLHEVSGAIDYAAGTVTISAPPGVFAHARVAPGALLSRFQSDSKETFLNLVSTGVAPDEVTVADTAASSGSRLASAC